MCTVFLTPPPYLINLGPRRTTKRRPPSYSRVKIGVWYTSVGKKKKACPAVESFSFPNDYKETTANDFRGRSSTQPSNTKNEITD